MLGIKLIKILNKTTSNPKGEIILNLLSKLQKEIKGKISLQN